MRKRNTDVKKHYQRRSRKETKKAKTSYINLDKLLKTKGFFALIWRNHTCLQTCLFTMCDLHYSLGYFISAENKEDDD